MLPYATFTLVHGPLSDALNVRNTPTVLVLRHGRTVSRWDRAMKDDELAALYDDVGRACAVAG